MDRAMEISDELLLERYSSLALDQDSKEFWRGCLQGKLLISRCQDCGHYQHFPRPMCPRCWSYNTKPTEVSGKGRVYFFSLRHQGPGAAPGRPYPIAAIELAEQPALRMFSTIVNCEPKDIRIDMPVKLTWIDFKGAPVPAFEPDGG